MTPVSGRAATAGSAADGLLVDLRRGEPDLPPPDAARAATRKVLRERFGYNSGLPEFRTAVADALSRRYQVRLSASSVVPTHGATGALCAALCAVAGPGAEVAHFSPAWPLLPKMIRMAGAVPVAVPILGGDPVIELRRRITPRTAAVVINSPHNPTGIVLDPGVLTECIALAASTGPGAWIISDETYERLVYPPAVHACALQLVPAYSRKILVGSFSKTFSMAGWRIGYAIVPSGIRATVEEINHTLTGGVSLLSQQAAVAALATPEAAIDGPVRTYQRRRDIALEQLAAFPDIQVRRPDGTFYLFLDMRQRGLTSEKSAALLLDRGVALLPGSDFGGEGEGYLRLAMVRPAAELTMAIQRIGAPW